MPPRKQFGQHWLRSERALQQILQAAALTQADRVLEIGPGTGVLTRRLLPLVQSLVAVEVDRDLWQRLGQEFGTTKNFRLLEGDFLQLDLAMVLAETPEFSSPNKVVANIPYNITGPILEKLLGTIAQPTPRPYEVLVLLVQKEVAERLAARPGSRAFGALSVRVQYLAACEIICTVPARAFYPPPKVDSAVIRLQPYASNALRPCAQNPAFLDQLVRLGFASRRKMLRNNLTTVVERDDLNALLGQLGVNPQARAEDLSVEQWVELSNLVGGCRSIWSLALTKLKRQV